MSGTRRSTSATAALAIIALIAVVSAVVLSGVNVGSAVTSGPEPNAQPPQSPPPEAAPPQQQPPSQQPDYSGVATGVNPQTGATEGVPGTSGTEATQSFPTSTGPEGQGAPTESTESIPSTPTTWTTGNYYPKGCYYPSPWDKYWYGYDKPTMAPKEAKLPFTGGDPIGFWLWGAALLGLGAVVGFPLRKSTWGAAHGKLMITAGVVLALFGAGLAAYPALTDARAQMTQRSLVAEATPKPDTGGQNLPSGAVARLVIPKISLDTLTFQGTEQNVLSKGPGHYPDTSLPGENGNAAIAAHRTMWGHFFGRLNELAAGDEIVTYTPQRRAIYRVVSVTPVDPTNIAVVAPTSDNRLTLTTCHPPGSAAQRLVVVAALQP